MHFPPLVAFSPPVVPSAVSGLCSSLHPIRNVCESSADQDEQNDWSGPIRCPRALVPSCSERRLEMGRHARVHWSRHAQCTVWKLGRHARVLWSRHAPSAQFEAGPSCPSSSEPSCPSGHEPSCSQPILKKTCQCRRVSAHPTPGWGPHIG